MTDIEYIKYLRQKAIALKFSFPPNFKRYNSKRLLRCYNGIGAEWMPKWFRNFVTYIWNELEAAALLHDFEYTHGPKSYWRFTVSNIRLAYNAAKSGRPLLGIGAMIVCQLFGWGAYKAGREVLGNGTAP